MAVTAACGFKLLEYAASLKNLLVAKSKLRQQTQQKRTNTVTYNCDFDACGSKW